MKKYFFLIPIIASITIVTSIFACQRVFAFPNKYQPPPPPVEVPIPPPEELPPPEEPGTPTTPIPPTPTPCIPNWCYVEQTTCCFDPICIFLGETNKGKSSRCDISPVNYRNMVSSPSKTISLIGRISLFFQSLFQKK